MLKNVNKLQNVDGLHFPASKCLLTPDVMHYELYQVADILRMTIAVGRKIKS